MLRPERIERLRKSLLEERESLTHQLRRLDDTLQETNVGLGNHMADDATAAFDQAASVSMRRSHEVMLDDVESALHRIDEGVYGRCDRCTEEIDFARLKARPSARLCMSCQRISEL